MLKIDKKNTLKILFAMIFTIGFLSAIPKITIAHSPNSMSLNYATQSNALTVIINHSVNDNTTHYINLVEIWVNDQLNISQGYTSQPTTNEFTYMYSITTANGDEIKVTATCNIGGSITRIITAGETPTDSVPASFVCMTVLGLLTTGGIMRRKKK